jgi:hypothetical protein
MVITIVTSTALGFNRALPLQPVAGPASQEGCRFDMVDINDDSD